MRSAESLIVDRPIRTAAHVAFCKSPGDTLRHAMRLLRGRLRHGGVGADRPLCQGQCRRRRCDARAASALPRHRLHHRHAADRLACLADRQQAADPGGGLGLVVFLPFLALAGEPLLLAAALLGFGASLGTIDVAVNVHAVEVERDAPVPLMSNFHAMFSIGGFAGAGGVTALLSQGLSPTACALVASAGTLVALGLAWPRLLAARGEEPPPLVAPKGIVLLLAALAGITFLVEGALLDWSALLVVEKGLSEPSSAGIGYMLFSVAMTFGRLTGDRIVAALGGRLVMVVGGLVTIAGLAVLLLSQWPGLAMGGFVLIGLGASNIVPVLFSLGGPPDGHASGARDRGSHNDGLCRHPSGAGRSRVHLASVGPADGILAPRGAHGRHSAVGRQGGNRGTARLTSVSEKLILRIKLIGAMSPAVSADEVRPCPNRATSSLPLRRLSLPAPVFRLAPPKFRLCSQTTQTSRRPRMATA